MSDAWDRAADATLPPKVYFGQVFTLADDVYISKGEPKRLWDSERDSVDRRFTQIKIDGQCTRANGSTYEINREVIAEFGREWAGIILPSLKVAGIHPRDLNERWASWEMVETGRTYTNDYGLQKATTFKFLAVYDSEEECRAAEAAHYSRAGDDEADEEDASATHPMPEDDPAPANDAQREVAARFLPALWAQSGGDVTEFGRLLASNPLTSKHFDLNSAEVAALVAGEAGS